MDSETFTVIVCGGRDYADRDTAFRALDHFHGDSERIRMVVQGGAHGADAIAHDWAQHHYVPQHVCPAHWSLHGNAAGPIRNAEMLGHQPVAVLAFPGGKGTADMCQQAREAGVPVWNLNEAGVFVQEPPPAVASSAPASPPQPTETETSRPHHDPLHHVRANFSQESAESMVTALREVLDYPTQASGYLFKDGKPDEEMILWNRTIIPWVGCSIATRSHCEILEITRIHRDYPHELRFGGYRLNKNRRAVKGVYDAIVGVPEAF